MKILYYDCFSGISGDMNLGSLIDLGVDPNYLKEELRKINIDDEFELVVEKSIKMGITGTKAKVILKNSDKAHHHGEHSHSHNHSHSHDHTHSHNENNSHGRHEHTHTHDRNFMDIKKIIVESKLNERVKELSLKIFEKIAIAEGKVHGKPIDEVHFHEVGATDSLVDIIGGAIAIDYLDVDKVMASTIQVGQGFVWCEHGKIPVPAPATTEILKDIPIQIGGVDGEATTPTGAAILAATVEKYTDNLDFNIEKIGYGVGDRDFAIPNVLRTYIGKQRNREKQLFNSETQDIKQFILETNIDDMNPEIYNYVEEKLLKTGAKDVFRVPIIMKKGRTGTKLNVLTDSSKEKEILDILFRDTTTTGVRKYKVDKIFMERNYENIETQYGEITVKNAIYDNEIIKYKAEYEQCKKIALEKNIPITEIYREVDRVLEKKRSFNLE